MVCNNHILKDNSAYLGELDFKNENDSKKKLNDWIIENSDNFNLVALHMNKTKEHQHWRVRLQLVCSCDVLLKKCSR